MFCLFSLQKSLLKTILYTHEQFLWSTIKDSFFFFLELAPTVIIITVILGVLNTGNIPFDPGPDRALVISPDRGGCPRFGVLVLHLAE